MKTLSVAEACKSFSECVNRVYSRKESIAIVELGVPHAMLVPAPVPGCDSHELAEDLAKVRLSVEDKKAVAAAVRKGREALKPLKNPWD